MTGNHWFPCLLSNSVMIAYRTVGSNPTWRVNKTAVLPNLKHGHWTRQQLKTFHSRNDLQCVVYMKQPQFKIRSQFCQRGITLSLVYTGNPLINWVQLVLSKSMVKTNYFLPSQKYIMKLQQLNEDVSQTTVSIRWKSSQHILINTTLGGSYPVYQFVHLVSTCQCPPRYCFLLSTEICLI